MASAATFWSFVLVGAFLVLVWAVIDVHGFFWLVFLVAGWGIGGDESLRCPLAAAGFQGKPSTATGREDKPDRPAPSGQL